MPANKCANSRYLQIDFDQSEIVSRFYNDVIEIITPWYIFWTDGTHIADIHNVCMTGQNFNLGYLYLIRISLITF